MSPLIASSSFAVKSLSQLLLARTRLESPVLTANEGAKTSVSRALLLFLRAMVGGIRLFTLVGVFSNSGEEAHAEVLIGDGRPL